MKMEFRNKKDIYSTIKLVFCVSVVLLLVLPNSSVANRRTIDDRLINLSDRHGEIFFAAIVSIQETKNIYFENVGKPTGDQCAELSLYERRFRLDERQKKVLIEASIKFLKKREDRNKILTKINHWCIAKRNFEIITSYEGISEEDIFAAIYENQLTKPLFASVLKNRGFDPKGVSPLEVAGTLASAEQKIILCETLNILSGLGETQLMGYFSNILRFLADSKAKNTARSGRP